MHFMKTLKRVSSFKKKKRKGISSSRKLCVNGESAANSHIYIYRIWEKLYFCNHSVVIQVMNKHQRVVHNHWKEKIKKLILLLYIYYLLCNTYNTFKMDQTLS